MLNTSFTLPNSNYLLIIEYKKVTQKVNAKAGLVIVILCIAGIAGGLYLFTMAPPIEDPGTPATLVIDFTPMDELAGEQDAATSAVKIYNTDLVLLETVTMDAASKASILQYTTDDRIGLYIYDATDVSICEQYMWVTVPLASSAEVYGQAFQFTVWNVDREVTIPMSVEEDGVDVADDAIKDASTDGWTTAYAYIDIEMRPESDDMGYVNTNNFLLDQKNNHYFVLDVYDVSGSTAGWHTFNILGSGFQTFDRNDHRYYVWELSDTDIKRDLTSFGTYVPTGLWQLNLAIDLTSITAGMNITIDYDYIMYADYDNFKDHGSWGPNVELTGEETFFIQY